DHASIEAAAKEFARRHRDTCYPEASDTESIIAAKAIIAAYEQERAKDGCEIVTVALQTADVLAGCEVWVNQSDSKASPRMNGPSMAETIRALVANHPSTAADVKTLEAKLAKAKDALVRCVEPLEAIVLAQHHKTLPPILSQSIIAGVHAARF